MTATPITAPLAASHSGHEACTLAVRIAFAIAAADLGYTPRRPGWMWLDMQEQPA